jgi:prepilin-type N-terminal cleavage/methylation domain-containing protein
MAGQTAGLPEATMLDLRRAGASGVTLIELVIVLAMIGIVAAIGLPRIDLARYQIDGAMQAVGTSLMVAQRLAVTRQHDVAVRFDLAGQALLIHEDANNNAQVDAGERVRRVVLGDKVVFGRGSAPAAPAVGPANPVTFTKTAEGFPVVTFHRNGSASEAGGFYLTSRRALTTGLHSDDARAVEIERATGRAAWYRYGNGTWTRKY